MRSDFQRVTGTANQHFPSAVGCQDYLIEFGFSNNPLMIRITLLSKSFLKFE